ncbi:hypothetical protein Lal_00022806 [Lupinus albus]|nr:hypothetical protein Lal_00022806 [Lupinus albus]
MTEPPTLEKLHHVVMLDNRGEAVETASASSSMEDLVGPCKSHEESSFTWYQSTFVRVSPLRILLSFPSFLFYFLHHFLSTLPPILLMANQLITPILDPTNPYYIHPNENPGATIVSCLLNGGNYHRWSRAMTMALQTKNKIKFIDETLTKPMPHDQMYNTWNRCNNLVVSWLIQAIEPSIVQGVLWMENAQEIWKDLRERYNQGDMYKISDLIGEMHSIKQGNASIDKFYTQMKDYGNKASMSPSLQLDHKSSLWNLCHPSTRCFQSWLNKKGKYSLRNLNSQLTCPLTPMTQGKGVEPEVIEDRIATKPAYKEDLAALVEAEDKKLALIVKDQVTLLIHATRSTNFHQVTQTTPIMSTAT